MKSKGEKIALVAAILIVVFYIVATISAIVIGISFFKNHIFNLKDSITSEKFVSAMKEEGFKVTEITANTKNQNVKEAYKAENGKYTVNFYVLEDESSAEDFFLNKQTQEDSNKSSKKISVSGRNYSTFTLVKSNKYVFIERINNTIIEVYGNSKNESDSKELLKSFGY